MVEGSLNGEPRFFNQVTFSDGSAAYVDLMGDSPSLTEEREMADRGYLWPGTPGGEGPEEGPKTRHILGETE